MAPGRSWSTRWRRTPSPSSSAAGPRSALHITTSWPRRCACSAAAPVSMPRGGRYQRGGEPVAAVRTSVARSISARISSAVSRAALRWLHVWLASSWPPAMRRRTRSGCATTCWPMRKKVAWAPAAASASQRDGREHGVRPVVERDGDGRPVGVDRPQDPLAAGVRRHVGAVLAGLGFGRRAGQAGGQMTRRGSAGDEPAGPHQAEEAASFEPRWKPPVVHSAEHCSWPRPARGRAVRPISVSGKPRSGRA